MVAQSASFLARVHAASSKHVAHATFRSTEIDTKFTEEYDANKEAPRAVVAGVSPAEWPKLRAQRHKQNERSSKPKEKYPLTNARRDRGLRNGQR